MPEQTPEQLGREAGEAIANAIADNLEAVLLKMADAIARVQAEQGEARERDLDLAARIERLEQPPRIHPPSTVTGPQGGRRR